MRITCEVLFSQNYYYYFIINIIAVDVSHTTQEPCMQTFLVPGLQGVPSTTTGDRITASFFRFMHIKEHSTSK